MRISLEISKYPLTENYVAPIIDFIERLKQNTNLVVKTNAMSTHVFGEFDEVMSVFTKEVRESFEQKHKLIFVVKFFNGDLNE